MISHNTLVQSDLLKGGKMKSSSAAFLIISLVVVISPTIRVVDLRFCSLVLVPIIGVGIFYSLWLKSAERLRWKLKKQGIYGPKPSFLYGGNVAEMQKIQAAASPNNVYAEFVAHDYTSSLFPYFEQWRKLYGNIIILFLFLFYVTMNQ